MNRGARRYSAEGASGGMYREDAQVMCGKKLNVNYIC